MSNWFEDHPAPSIVSYTLVVIGATWATSTFVLQDNRLNLARSELEAQKTLAEQYKAKSELLQKDLEALRSENQEYKNWLAQSKDAIPIMVPQLVELKRQVARMNTQTIAENDIKGHQSQSHQRQELSNLRSLQPNTKGSLNHFCNHSVSLAQPSSVRPQLTRSLGL